MFYSFCAMKFTIRTILTTLLALAGLLLTVSTPAQIAATTQPAAKPTVADKRYCGPRIVGGGNLHHR